MSSFLKTSFIYDETARSESLVLLLKRSFSRQHHLHFFLVFSIPRLSPCIVSFALGLHQRQTGIAGNVSIYKRLITVGWRTVWTHYSDYRFSKKVQLSRHHGPHRTKKKFSHAIFLCLVRVRKLSVHCNSKSTAVMFSCTLALGRLATAPAHAAVESTSARRAGGATPGPAHAPGRFAKAGQARLRSISAASWSTGVWAVTEPDACVQSELRKFLQNQFSFLWKMCDLWFSIRNQRNPPPPVLKCVMFRKKLRTYEMLPKGKRVFSAHFAQLKWENHHPLP